MLNEKEKKFSQEEKSSISHHRRHSYLPYILILNSGLCLAYIRRRSLLNCYHFGLQPPILLISLENVHIGKTLSLSYVESYLISCTYTM